MVISQATIWTVARTSSRPTSCNRRRAFTLLELVVVLLIVSIIAGATLLSLRTPLQTARLKQAIASLQDADRRARLESQKSGYGVELTIDGRNGTATQTLLSDQRSTKSTRALNFHGGLHIDRFVTRTQSTFDDQFRLKIAPTGQSDTYAIRLTTNKPERRSTQTWLIVIGATGQYIQTNKESVIDSIVRR